VIRRRTSPLLLPRRALFAAPALLLPRKADAWLIAGLPPGGILMGHLVAQDVTGNGMTSTALDITGASLIVTATATLSAGPVISDLLGNTYNNLTNQNSSGTNLCFRYSVPTIFGNNTWTVTAGGGNSSLAVAVFRNTKASSPFDQENGNTNGATSSVQTGSVTPTTDNQVVIYAATENGGSGADFPLSVDVGTILENVAFTANAQAMALAYAVQGTAAATNPTWSWPNLHFGAAVIATFKPAP